MRAVQNQVNASEMPLNSRLSIWLMLSNEKEKQDRAYKCCFRLVDRRVKAILNTKLEVFICRYFVLSCEKLEW